MLLSEAVIPKGHPGTGVHEAEGLSRGQMSAAALTSPCPQAAERHGSFEEHVRQLEGQLEEKKQELARVRAWLGSERPPRPTAGFPGGLWRGLGGSGSWGGTGWLVQRHRGREEQGGLPRRRPGKASRVTRGAQQDGPAVTRARWAGCAGAPAGEDERGPQQAAVRYGGPAA